MQTKAARLKAVGIVAGGNFLEMYDFMVYGYYAVIIAKVYFPSDNVYASTMASLAAFGAGFVMRPLGALFLGALLDRHGRRNGLLITLCLMAIGTLTIALVPGYAAIGLAAPLLVLLGRLIQGLSAGVEVGGVSVYLAEIATPRNKGFYVSWQSASQQLAVIFAALIGFVVSSNLTEAQMVDWGWRVPFLIGCLLIPFLLFVRSRLVETPEFLERERKPTTGEIFRTIAGNWQVVTLGTMMATFTTVGFYTVTAYTPTYASATLRLSLDAAFFVTFCVGLSNFILLPVAGAISDRIGRLPLLVGATVLAILTSYPALRWLVDAPSMGRLLAVQLWVSAIYAFYNGAMIVYLTEVMPRHVRTAGFSLAYSLATAIFGGFTPLIATALIQATGDKAAPGLWLSGAAFIGLSGAVLLKRQHRPQPAPVPA